MSQGSGATLHGQFERQAMRRPDAIAIATPGGSWTYEEVWRRARGIAAAIGGGAGLVGVLLADPLEAVSAMLGVLAAGQVLVPLEPRWPASRLGRVISEAGVRLLITEESLRDVAKQLPALTSLVLSGGLPAEREVPAERYVVGHAPREPVGGVPVEREAPAMPASEVLSGGAPEPVGAPANVPAAGSGALAYVLFTSGSTGAPKGVMQSHQNALAHLQAYSRALGIRPEDGLTLVSSFAVDAAVMDIWGALLNGAALHVLDVRATAPGEIARWMRARGTTILHATPTVFRHLAGSLPDGEVLSGLRCVVLGGEPARRRDLELFRARLPRGAALVNGYGPTESTVSLQCFLDHDSVVEGELLPLGHPTEGMEVVLLEEEIGLRSSRVALGYWGREDLTTRAFTQLPSGERLYRTGDLGRRREDGSFEFAGRGDLRMKSRGWWIDPQAVEARLLQHPLVREAIVLPCEDERPGACLLMRGVAPGDEALRAFLAQQLPEAAMAARFAVLDAWPLTASGKVDLAALRERLARAGDAAAAEPWDQTEAAIARMVSRLLGVRPPGRHESLMALGGDSLLATRLAAAIQEQLGAAVTPRDVLEHPTAAALSRVVRGALEKGPPLRGEQRPDRERRDRRADRERGEQRPDRERGDEEADRVGDQPVRARSGALERGIPLRVPRAAGIAPVPASLHQRRYLARMAREPSAAFQLAFQTEIRGPLDVGALAESLRAVVRRHDALRTAFIPRGDGYVQHADPAAQLDVPVVDLSEEVFAEARAPFDLSRPPLLRATLARCAPDRHVLVWAVHHLVTDGWSRRVIEDELQTFYRSAIAGAPAPLGELPFQYADYSRWLEGAFGPQLDFWRATLRGFEPLRLHSSGPEGPAQTARFRLTAEHSARLDQLGRAAGATPFMVYLAAFALALSRFTGRTDLVVTTDVAGRVPLETEALVGLFTNVVPIRLDTRGAPRLEELAARAREAVAGALEHQLLPFAAVADALWPGQLHRYDELFPAAFFVEEPEAGSRWLSTRELPTGATSRDLILVVRPSPEGTQAELTSRARVGARTVGALLAELRAVLEGPGR